MGRKKRAGSARPGSPAWMASYADMVTLLMCFFVLLFSMSTPDAERFRQLAEVMAGQRMFLSGALGNVLGDSAGLFPDNSPPMPPIPVPEPVEDEPDEMDLLAREMEARMATMEAMAVTFRTYMAPTEMADLVQVVVSDLGEYIRLVFPSGMLFDSGQALLRPEAVEMIDYVALELVNYHPAHRIEIHGHTDSIPISTLQFPSNDHLSAARAISVKHRLVNAHGFNPRYVNAVGQGEYWPVDDNATAEGRANNRRVEILVFAQQVNLAG